MTKTILFEWLLFPIAVEVVVVVHLIRGCKPSFISISYEKTLDLRSHKNRTVQTNL